MWICTRDTRFLSHVTLLKVGRGRNGNRAEFVKLWIVRVIFGCRNLWNWSCWWDWCDKIKRRIIGSRKRVPVWFESLAFSVAWFSVKIERAFAIDFVYLVEKINFLLFLLCSWIIGALINVGVTVYNNDRCVLRYLCVHIRYVYTFLMLIGQ